MSLSNRKYTYDALASISGDGLDIALYPQIRDAIADRMREIYGNDIDLSTASADGQYINMESFILDNIYKLINYLYINMDPNTAQGKYLDILCALSNVKRLGSTRSVANVVVKNIMNRPITPVRIDAIDRNGVTWTWINPTSPTNLEQKAVRLTAGSLNLLPFTCEMSGPVEATKGTQGAASISDIDWTLENFDETNGSIYQPIEYGRYMLYQLNDAIVGQDQESDQALRNRKNSYLGANSITTQAALETALYNYPGIEDVYVCNQVAESPYATLKDEATVALHDVYISLRYKEGLSENTLKTDISKIIYNKLTPGVITSQGDADDTTIEGGSIVTQDFTLVTGLETTIAWKKCEPVSPQITINITTLPGWNDTNNKAQLEKVLTAYFNNLKIGEDLTSINIMAAAMQANIPVNGLSTFIITGCTITGAISGVYTNPLTYYKYTNFVFNTVTDNTLTLTIS